MEILFWTSILVVGYVYAGYPLLLAAWARVAARPARRRPADDRTPWPALSIVIAARNEGARLPARVRNLLDLPYPGSREIIIVSDGSTDAPARALAPYASAVRLIEIPSAGKPAALNAGVDAATGDILVFADARQRFDRGALEALASNFADPSVGGVTGELVLDCEGTPDDGGSTIGEGVGLYWKYETWLRRQEGLIASTLGATGAIYALRRSLWRPLPHHTLLDDVLAPMRAVLDGHRVVFDERAVAYDRTSPDAAAESRRKTRTLAGNYQMLALEPLVLVPLRNPVWLQYLSHKVGRLVVPWALLGALVTSVALAPRHWGYTAALGAQLAFYGLAFVGGILDWRERHARARGSGEGLAVVAEEAMR